MAEKVLTPSLFSFAAGAKNAAAAAQFDEAEFHKAARKVADHELRSCGQGEGQIKKRICLSLYTSMRPRPQLFKIFVFFGNKMDGLNASPCTNQNNLPW